MRSNQLDDVLFAVEERPVFVPTRDGSGDHQRAVPGKKAIVDIVSERVLGIVGRDYRLVTNQQALEWAYACCESVFPETVRAEWDVSATDGPATGGHCRIDLVHRTARLDFGDVRPGQRPDAFGPFIRVTNSYNGLRALAFDIGFYRKVCQNGLIAADTIVRFRFAHQQRNLGMGIRFEVARERLEKLKASLTGQLAALKGCQVPGKAFAPLLRNVLKIRPLKSARPAPVEAADWTALENAIRLLCSRYQNDLGDNAYAVLNAVTDFASRPPVNRHLRRDRHALQRLAGSWLTAC